MKASDFYTLSGAVAAVVVFGGCSVSQSQRVGAESMLGPRLQAQTATSRSWMMPEARKTSELLYISLQYDDVVLVYNYKTGNEVGVLQGFNFPDGQCVDKIGDIWITNNSEYSIVEYAHGGTEPIRTLTTDNYPIGCSIDPMSGNLAVANFDFNTGAGDVQVFPDGSGSATSYYSPSCSDIGSPGYDDKGNLYLLARDSPTQVCELPHNGASLRVVSVNVTINGPGGVMWDGKYITLTDQYYKNRRTTGIYRATEASSGDLTVVGSTQLTDTCHSGDSAVSAPFIVGRKNTPANRRQGNVIVGGDYYICENALDFWRYPAGGNPLEKINLDEAPHGQAVSIGN